MKATSLVFVFSLLAGLTAGVQAQTGRPSTERIWKDLSRLPQTLRDELKKSSWWKSTPAGPVRLDSVLTLTHFSNGEFYPLNKTTYEYTAAGASVQSDYVNYGQWVLQKRTKISRDPQQRIVEVIEEEPDPTTGAFQPSTRLNFYWHGKSDSQCDSVLTSQWDDQWQQWEPADRLLSFFDAKGRETATETYRYTEGFQGIGIREEYQYDASGDIAFTRQLLWKNGAWALLGKVESKFDPQHHETARQEDIAQGAKRFASVRKLNRSFDEKGKLTREERFKWNESSKSWAPLKTITKGANPDTRSEWTNTESYKPNAYFQSKVETFRRRNDDLVDREVQSTLHPDSKNWQVLSETRYFYSH